jgi:hypothetical protein
MSWPLTSKMVDIVQNEKLDHCTQHYAIRTPHGLHSRDFDSSRGIQISSGRHHAARHRYHASRQGFQLRAGRQPFSINQSDGVTSVSDDRAKPTSISLSRREITGPLTYRPAPLRYRKRPAAIAPEGEKLLIHTSEAAHENAAKITGQLSCHGGGDR